MLPANTGSVKDLIWNVDWVLLIIASQLFSRCFVAIACRVLWLLFIKLQPFSLSWENFKERSVRKLVVFVQGKLCSISKLICRAVYDWFSFFHFEIWLVCSLLFHSGVAEWSFPGDRELFTHARQHI